MHRHLYLTFGTIDDHQTWIVGLGDEPVPGLGATVSVVLPRLSEQSSPAITAEIRHRSWVPGQPLEVIAYGGAVVPPQHIAHAMTVVGCQIVDPDTSRACVDTVLHAPSTVSGHEVLLVCGQPKMYQVWRWYGQCEDAVVPVFGQQIPLPVYAMTHAPWGDVLARTEMGADNYVAHGQVFYAAKSDTADAHVGVYLPTNKDVDGYHLVAAGWEQLGRDQFRVEDFDVWQRVHLAQRTTIFERTTANGTIGLDVEVDRLADIPEDQVSLLPYGLQHLWRQEHHP